MDTVALDIDVVRLLLERTIELHRSSALKLLILSKWVRGFLEPVLYHTIDLDQLPTLELFVRTMSMRPDLDKHVRRLRLGKLRSSLFGHPVMDGFPHFTIRKIWALLHAVIAVCLNVQQLAFWVEQCNGGLAMLLLVQLKRLSFKVNYQPADVIDMLPSGNSLTHLHLHFFTDEDIARLRWPDVFERCHELTHILVTGSQEGFPSAIAHGDVKSFPRIVNAVLAVLPVTIRKFVVVLNPLPDTAPETIAECLSRLHNDQRLVVGSTENTFLGRVRGLRCYPDTHEIAADWGYDDGIWELADGV